MTTEFAWHVHHNLLVEPLRKPIKNRIKYIKQHKPKEEQAQRLALLKPVLGALPDSVVKAGADLVIAQTDYEKAYEKARVHYGAYYLRYEKAKAAYEEIYEEQQLAIEALHKLECPDCPWDGETIFPHR